MTQRQVIKLSPTQCDFGLGESKQHDWRLIIETPNLFELHLKFPLRVYYSLVLTLEQGRPCKVSFLAFDEKKGAASALISSRDSRIMGIKAVDKHLLNAQTQIIERLEQVCLEQVGPMHFEPYLKWLRLSKMNPFVSSGD